VTPIGKLKLEPTTRDMLVAAGIKTAEDLAAQSAHKLRRLPNFARRHLNEVKGALSQQGLSLTVSKES